jgi:hypothetical protein
MPSLKTQKLPICRYSVTARDRAQPSFITSWVIDSRQKPPQPRGFLSFWDRDGYLDGYLGRRCLTSRRHDGEDAGHG